MNQPGHDDQLLGAYALGILDAAETRAVDEHLAGCERCRTELTELREMEALLGEMPPEAFLDGPPEGGDLLLQRTLRQVRAESARETRSGRILAVAAAVVGALVVLGAGVVVGRGTAPVQAAATTTVTPTTTAVPGTRDLRGTDPSGTVIQASLIPKAGWVWVHTMVSGIPAGQKCRLVVVAKSGDRQQAGGWVVSAKGAAEGTILDGTALIAPDQVAAIEIENTDGKKFVTVAT